MKQLRQKTISGMKWAFIDNIFYQGSNFLIGIILARLLLPADFGLVGMITVVFAITQTFVDSGFGQALIQKKDCTDKDYATVFLFNLVVAVILYIVIFIIAPFISSFFNEKTLTSIMKVLGLNLIISGLSQIQRTIRTKRLDFKLQTKVTIISNVTSGIIAIFLAYYGFGVWSLVWKSIAQNLFTSALLWYWNNWKPVLTFSKESFKGLFGFGSKLLATSLLDKLFRNIYYLVIGKFFTAADLGYYSRAESFTKLPSENITDVMQRVSFPVLSTIQDDNERLKSGYKKIIITAVFFSFTIMISLAASSESVVIALIGEKWRQTIPYLQILCFAAMLYPLHVINLNMLKVKGRSDLFLKIEVIKKIINIPIIIVGVFWGIQSMMIGIFVLSVVSYFLNSYWSGALINYNMIEQLKDVAPSFFLGIVMGIIIYLLKFIVTRNMILLLVIQAITGFILLILFAELLKLESYQEVKKILFMKKST